MKLWDLLAAVEPRQVSGEGDPLVHGLCYDSRRVKSGDLFFAWQGSKIDGHRFVPEAVGNGAVAVVGETEPKLVSARVPYVRVDNARAALARMADRFFGHPSRSMDVVGITGTNGKTTTAFLVHHILERAGRKSGLVGTVRYSLGGRTLPACRTTPEGSDLQELLSEMREGGCRAAVLEVSSHALVQGRVDGVDFTIGVFTNLTSDHLDFHGSRERYAAAKALLFERVAASGKKGGAAVLNADDPVWRALGAVPRRPKTVLLYSAQGAPGADFRAEEVRKDASGSSFRLHYPGGSLPVRVPLLGSFNVENVLGAFAAAFALGISPPESAGALADFPGVPGRMERFGSRDGVIAVVDYAHTEDALRKTLKALRDLAPKRLAVVVGCGGDRDRTKRPKMAAAACELADRVFFTSDNPRSESIDRIFADMAEGVPAGRRPAWIPDRRLAIERALRDAEPGDLVFIAGKGHETTQEVQGVFHPFDDRSTVSDVLAAR